jgi:hypothetical protein
MTAGCDNFKTSSLTIGMQLVQITRFNASRIAQNYEATNTNFIVFGLTRPGLEPMIYRTQEEHAYHYAEITLAFEDDGPLGWGMEPTGASLYTWLTYDKDKSKMYCSKCISIGANNTMTAGCDNFKTSSLTIISLVDVTDNITHSI